MFDLDKFIKMVKKGEIPSKPFNIRKKSWEEDPDEYIRRNTDLPDAEKGYNQDFYGDPVNTYEEQKLNLQRALTPEQIKEQKKRREVIQQEMALWVEQNAQNMNIESQGGTKELEEKLKNPDLSLLQSNKFLVEEMLNDTQLVSDLSKKIQDATKVDEYMANLFIGTMVAKYQGEEASRAETAERVARENKAKEDAANGIAATPVEEKKEKFDPIYEAVWERFNPDSLSGADLDKVLEDLSPGGSGTGNIYDMTKFTEAVREKFGPQKGNLDQRMNFFLKNSKLLLNPYFPEGNIFQKVNGLEDALREALGKLGINNPDITEALRSVGETTAQMSGGRVSPRSVITNILKEYAEPELHEILQILIKEGDSSIVDWFKSKLKYVDTVDSTSLFNNPEITDYSAGLNTESRAKMEKATPEQQQKAIDQNTAIVETYFGEQVEILDMMKDETVSNLMSSEYKKYAELKKSYATAQGEEKAKIENKMRERMKLYTNSEFLTGFSNYAIKAMKDFFKEATAVVSKRKALKSGEQQAGTELSYSGKYGRAKVPAEEIEKIFEASKDSEDSRITNRDYVKDYIKKINQGVIADPYVHDFSTMANRTVQYDAFADLFIIKSQIKTAYKNKIDQRSEHSRSGEDIIDSILRDFTSHAPTNEMLNNFSGASADDDAGEETRKKRNFISMTIDQTDDNLKTYKKCYYARKKYADQRSEIDPNLPKAEKQKKLSIINRAENEGDINGYKKDKNGKAILNDKEELIPTRDKGCVKKNIKSKLKRSAWQIFPAILESLQKPRTNFNSNLDDLARKEFINIFAKDDRQYEQFIYKGKDVNPYDPQGRTNTELYWEIKEGKVPEDIKKIIDFSKSKPQNTLTKNDNMYISNLNNIFGLKKKLRSLQLLVNDAKSDLNEHISNRLNYQSERAINKILSQKDPDAQYKMVEKLGVPPLMVERFIKQISNWNKLRPLRDEYNNWLQIFGPVNKKNTLTDTVKKYQRQVDDQIDLIKKREILNEKLRQKVIASGKSYLRMVTAEYERVLSKIDKLHKIRRSSYKFASIDPVSIDDTILGIEKDFENLLDSLVR